MALSTRSPEHRLAAPGGSHGFGPLTLCRTAALPGTTIRRSSDLGDPQQFRRDAVLLRHAPRRARPPHAACPPPRRPRHRLCGPSWPRARAGRPRRSAPPPSSARCPPWPARSACGCASTSMRACRRRPSSRRSRSPKLGRLAEVGLRQGLERLRLHPARPGACRAGLVQGARALPLVRQVRHAPALDHALQLRLQAARPARRPARRRAGRRARAGERPGHLPARGPQRRPHGGRPVRRRAERRRRRAAGAAPRRRARAGGERAR